MVKSLNSASLLVGSLLLLSGVTSAYAQSQEQADRINRNFDRMKNYKFNIQTPGKIQKAGEVQKAGEIQQAGQIQKAGDIKIPRGLDAITVKNGNCQHRLLISADTLFEFDKATLSPYAEEALKIVGPEIQSLGLHPMRIEGHTDALGGDDYNQHLSEARAERVKNWLLENDYIKQGEAQSTGYGKKRPVAPNTKADGTDNPKGRQLNRRVEIVVDTCTAWDPNSSSGGQTWSMTMSADQAKNSPAASPSASSASPPASSASTGANATTGATDAAPSTNPDGAPDTSGATATPAPTGR